MSPQNHADCPHWGKGGRYVINAEGKRERQAPAAPDKSAAPAAPAPQPSIKKGR